MIKEKTFRLGRRVELTVGINTEVHEDYFLTPALVADVSLEDSVFALGIAWCRAVAYVDVDWNA